MDHQTRRLLDAVAPRADEGFSITVSDPAAFAARCEAQGVDPAAEIERIRALLTPEPVPASYFTEPYVADGAANSPGDD